jgi:hypothetical protein
MVKDKLRELINKLVREEMMEGSTVVDPKTSSGKAAEIAQSAGVNVTTVKTAIEQAKKTNEPSTVPSTKAEALIPNVFYYAKPNFTGNMENLKMKLTKTKYAALVQITNILRDAGVRLTADQITQRYNALNPDQKPVKQQGLVRPITIGSIGDGENKIQYSDPDMPFTSTQIKITTPHERANKVVTPSEKRGEKFGREVVDEPKPLKNPDFKLSDDQADIANKMLNYKDTREAYRKADKPEEKQKYLNRLQSIANDPKMGKEIAQQYMDGIIATQDPATLSAYKKYKDEIQRESSKRKNKPKYKVQSFSSRNQDVTIDNPEETEED